MMEKRKIVDGTFLGRLSTVLKEKNESQDKQQNESNDPDPAAPVQDTENKR